MNNQKFIIQKIRDYVANNQLDSAFQLLYELLADSPRLNEVIQLDRRYASLREKIRLGIITSEDTTLIENQISQGVLGLVSEIEREGKQQLPLQNKIPHALTQPPFLSEVFIGRTTELETIRERLFSDKRPLLLVNGQGGIGKTTLASHYYNNYKEEYTHVAWVLSEKNIANALLQLAPSLGLDFDDRMDTSERLSELLKAMAHLQHPCLLVIDNANELLDLQHHYQNLRRCSNFHLLLTTRVNELEQAAIYRIEGLSEADALTLFKTYYPALTDEESETVRQIYHAVGANTLVIELLAKNLRQINRFRPRYAVAELLADICKKGLFHFQSEAEVSTDYGKLKSAKPEDIITAMYDMTDLSDQERQLLSIFALLPPENIPFTVLKDLLSDPPQPDKSYSTLESIILRFSSFFKGMNHVNVLAIRLENWLNLLHQKGWIEHNEANNTFKISPVIQQIVKEKQKYKLHAHSKFLIFNLITKLKYQGGIGHPLNVTYEDASLYARYGESILDELEIVADNHNLTYLCDRIGNYYNVIGDIDKAIYFFEKQRIFCEKICQIYPSKIGYKHHLALSYLGLGNTHISLGNLKEALQFFEKYNEIEGKLYKRFPKDTSFKIGLANSYSSLGRTYTSLGNLEKALKFFEKSCELETQLCEKPPQNSFFVDCLASSYAQLGSTHRSLGNLEKALKFVEAYNQLEKQLYEAYPENVSFKSRLADSYSQLGNIHGSLDNLEKALMFYEKSSELRQELYESYPQNVSFQSELAYSYGQLGHTHHSLDNLEKALEFLKKYNEFQQQLYECYPQNISFISGLAHSYGQLGSIHSSLDNLEKALTFFELYNQLEKELHEDHPQNVSFKNQLAYSHSKLGDFFRDKLDDKEKARINFLECYEIWLVLSSEYPENVEFQKNYNTALKDLEDLNLSNS